MSVDVWSPLLDSVLGFSFGVQMGRIAVLKDLK